MITRFNKAELFVDSSQEAAANVWSKLKEAGIEYEMKTKMSEPRLLQGIHNGADASGSLGALPPSFFGEGSSYVYYIYVKKKDLERAKKLCSL